MFVCFCGAFALLCNVFVQVCHCELVCCNVCYHIEGVWSVVLKCLLRRAPLAIFRDFNEPLSGFRACGVLFYDIFGHLIYRMILVFLPVCGRLCGGSGVMMSFLAYSSQPDLVKWSYRFRLRLQVPTDLCILFNS